MFTRWACKLSSVEGFFPHDNRKKKTKILPVFREKKGKCEKIEQNYSKNAASPASTTHRHLTEKVQRC